MKNSLSFLQKQESRCFLCQNRILDSRSPIDTFEDKFHGNDTLLGYHIFKELNYYKV